MPVIYLAYKRKPWIVKYREPWTNKPRVKSFGKDEEEKARSFERAQADLYEREREIIRRTKRRRAARSPAGVTVGELLERYLDTLSNPSTRAASDYHLRLFFAVYGHRKAHCISMEDVAAFLDLPPRGDCPGGLQLGRPLGSAVHQSTGGPATGQPRAADAGPAHGP